MSAFAWFRSPNLIPIDVIDEGTSGKPKYEGNYNWELSNTPYLYPWGKKERNPFFIGPFPQVKTLQSTQQLTTD